MRDAVVSWLIGLCEKMDDISDRKPLMLWIVCSLVGTVIMSIAFHPNTFVLWLFMPIGGMVIGYVGMLPLFFIMMLVLRGIVYFLMHPINAIINAVIAVVVIVALYGIVMFFMGIIRGI